MTGTDPSSSPSSDGSVALKALPAWLQTESIRDLQQTVQERQTATRKTRARYLECLGEGETEVILDAWRDYQQAALEQRLAEGELLWGALGYAISDIAETADAEDPATVTRGEGFVSWAIETDILETVTERDRIEIELARRYPTLPPSHVPYVESMFDLGQGDVARLRERDQGRQLSERRSCQVADPMRDSIIIIR